MPWQDNDCKASVQGREAWGLEEEKACGQRESRRGCCPSRVRVKKERTVKERREELGKLCKGE
eukprot:3502416-Pleurochrysis_carterae.AAC.1